MQRESAPSFGDLRGTLRAEPITVVQVAASFDRTSIVDAKLICGVNLVSPLCRLR